MDFWVFKSHNQFSNRIVWGSTIHQIWELLKSMVIHWVKLHQGQKINYFKLQQLLAIYCPLCYLKENKSQGFSLHIALIQSKPVTGMRLRYLQIYKIWLRRISGLLVIASPIKVEMKEVIWIGKLWKRDGLQRKK